MYRVVGVQIGEVTSGTFSPTLNRPIAMGYVASDFSKEGSKVRPTDLLTSEG